MIRKPESRVLSDYCYMFPSFRCSMSNITSQVENSEVRCCRLWLRVIAVISVELPWITWPGPTLLYSYGKCYFIVATVLYSQSSDTESFIRSSPLTTLHLHSIRMTLYTSNTLCSIVAIEQVRFSTISGSELRLRSSPHRLTGLTADKQDLKNNHNS